MRRAVFLDRDGVVNRSIVRDGKPYPPATLKEFTYLPGVEDCIKQLRTAGYLVIIVTNQPDVATGIQKRQVVDLMHSKLYQDKLCDDIKVCYHTDEDRCDCRKPKSGMLLDASREWGISLKKSFMVGDRWRDIEAGKSAGCFTYFIDYQYEEKAPESPDEIVNSLEDAVNRILQKSNSEDLINAKS